MSDEAEQRGLLIPLVTLMVPVLWDVHFQASPDLMALERRMLFMQAQLMNEPKPNADSIETVGNVVKALRASIEAQTNVVRFDNKTLLWTLANAGMLAGFNVKPTDVPGAGTRAGHA